MLYLFPSKKDVRQLLHRIKLQSFSAPLRAQHSYCSRWMWNVVLSFSFSLFDSIGWHWSSQYFSSTFHISPQPHEPINHLAVAQSFKPLLSVVISVKFMWPSYLPHLPLVLIIFSAQGSSNCALWKSCSTSHPSTSSASLSTASPLTVSRLNHLLLFTTQRWNPNGV